MEISQKRRLSEIFLGFFLLSHPAPVLLHIIGVTVFTLLAAWPHFIWSTIFLVIAAHAAMQVSIAMINDYCDRQLDAVGKPQKPIPRNLVYPHEALLGALAMPLIPLYAFVGMGRMLPGLFWLVPVGVLLGVALNLANALPDIEEDAAGDARTLAVVLGAKRSLLLCRLLIVAGAVLIGILAVSRVVPVQGWVLIPTLLVTALAVVSLFLVLRDERSMRGRKLHFYISALTCIVLAAGWLIGVIV